jgi:hypothetical protein
MEEPRENNWFCETCCKFRVHTLENVDGLWMGSAGNLRIYKCQSCGSTLETVEMATDVVRKSLSDPALGEALKGLLGESDTL